MRSRLLVLTVVSALIAPATAAASLPARSPLGPAQGVQGSVSGTTVTIRFTGASAAWGKAHAGAQVALSCTAYPADKLLFSKPAAGDAETVATVRVAKDGGSVRHAFAVPGDVCVVISGAPQDDPTTLLSGAASSPEAALTPRGAAYIDEEARGTRLMDVLHAGAPRGAYGSAAAVVAAGGGEVVALDDPNGTPPAGKIGYWSKGRAVSAITTGADGRRLVVQDLGNGMVRTNVLGSVIGWLPVKPYELPRALAGAGTYEEDEAAVADEGLLLSASGDRVTFRFTGKAAKVFRRYAGRRVRAGCYVAPRPLLLTEALAFPSPPRMTTIRVPEHGGTVSFRAPGGAHDVCGLETLRGRDIAGDAVTTAGLRFEAQLIAPFFLLLLPVPQVAEATATRYPGLNTILATTADRELSGLRTPGAPLAPGQEGFWTDADLQALYATGVGLGLRFVIADEGHGMVRSNMLSGMATTLSLLAASLPEDRAASS